MWCCMGLAQGRGGAPILPRQTVGEKCACIRQTWASRYKKFALFPRFFSPLLMQDGAVINCSVDGILLCAYISTGTQSEVFNGDKNNANQIFMCCWLARLDGHCWGFPGGSVQPLPGWFFRGRLHLGQLHRR